MLGAFAFLFGIFAMYYLTFIDTYRVVITGTRIIYHTTRSPTCLRWLCGCCCKCGHADAEVTPIPLDSLYAIRYNTSSCHLFGSYITIGYRVYVPGMQPNLLSGEFKGGEKMIDFCFDATSVRSIHTTIVNARKNLPAMGAAEPSTTAARAEGQEAQVAGLPSQPLGVPLGRPLTGEGIPTPTCRTFQTCAWFCCMVLKGLTGR
jgi:hypothetical protein